MQVKLNNNVTIVGETVEGDYLFTYKSYDGTFKLASYNPDNISSDAVEVALIEAVKEVNAYIDRKNR